MPRSLTVCPPSAGTKLILRSTCTPNMKSLGLLTMKIWKETKNAIIGVVWGLGVTQGQMKVGLIICNSIPTIWCKDCENRSSGSWDMHAMRHESCLWYGHDVRLWHVDRQTFSSVRWWLVSCDHISLVQKSENWKLARDCIVGVFACSAFRSRPG